MRLFVQKLKNVGLEVAADDTPMQREQPPSV
jgi:hypothetical protein